MNLVHLLVVVVLILLLVGSLPSWPHAQGWGPYPSGVVGVVLVVVVILVLLGKM